MSDVIQVCEWCGSELDPSDPSVVRAVESHYVRTFGESQEVEGLEVFFHTEHFPEGDPSYRRVDVAAT